MSETSTPRIDVPEAYKSRMNLSYGGRLKGGEDFLEKRTKYTPNQQEQVQLEAEMLGVNPDARPDRFVGAHNALLSDIQTEVNAELPTVKQTVVERTAAYFADGDESTYKAISALLTRRLAATERVLVADNLVHANDLAGSFNTMGRQPVLVSSDLVLRMSESKDMDDFRDGVNNVTLAHEVMHGMFTSGVQETWFSDTHNIRNGLKVSQIDNPFEINEMKSSHYANWLSEATLESFRQTIMQTDEVSYEPGVMVLHMLDELSPGLRDRMVIAALDSSGPGPAFAEIEGLLGPTAIDDVEQLLVGVTNFAAFEGLKDQVTALLPLDLQERGRAILERQQEAIFAWRLDYEEKRQKVA